MEIIFIGLFIVGALCVGVSCFIVILFGYVNDLKIRKPANSFGLQTSVLAILAHPDDEVLIGGTLAKIKKAGGKIHLLYLTHGEDGPTGGIVEPENLKSFRRKEIEKVKQILKMDSLIVLDFPDRHLEDIDFEELKQVIQEGIHTIKPEILICFDHLLGLYGNKDHAISGQAVMEVVADMKQQKESDFLKAMWIMTLPQPMIKLAQKISQTFKQRFKEEVGLPEANIAITISQYGKTKKQIIMAHASQWQVLNDVQPLYNKIPYFIYYRIFSREYYHQINIIDKQI